LQAQADARAAEADARAAKEANKAAARARVRAAWRCQTCGKASDQVPRTVGKICKSCYDRARKAPRW